MDMPPGQVSTPPWSMDPPDGQQRNTDNPESIAASIVQVGLSCTILSLIVVGLRIYSRAFIIRGLKADDYLIMAAMACLIAFFSVSFLLTILGVGKHKWNVLESDFAPGILELMFVQEIIGCVMVSLNKLSVLALYLFLTRNATFRTTVFGLMTFVTIFSVAFVYLLTSQCDPVQAQWDPLSRGHCKTSNVSPLLVLSIINIIIDVSIIVMPIPIILPLQMPRKNKISCLLLFAAGGGIVCAATIGRTFALEPFNHPFQQIDCTWALVPELNWAMVEGSVGIIAASLPSLKPFVERLRCKKTRGGTGSGNDHPNPKLQLKALSDGSKKKAEAQQLQIPPNTEQPTLQQHGSADEELGLRPASITEGSVRRSSFSTKPLSDGPFCWWQSFGCTVPDPGCTKSQTAGRSPQ
ncbi:hypothetical protein Daus18300_009841 [Diaporthe australafricana]|uniref:Rhodopsin domain-containing protein n=1 Tax=Diaporthe australafricana TaxID=127596 RepID=A0ABR3WCL7_9PEZI